LQFAIPKFPAIFSLVPTKGDSHGNDLAEIKQRQDLLEAQLNALEARIDWQEGMLKLVDAGIGATARPGGRKPQAAPGDSDVKTPRIGGTASRRDWVR
jgi:hypothetical protein